MAESNAARELRRDLGVWSAVAIVVGTVIGSGIFLVPTKMILSVGSTPMVFAVWIVAGLLSLAGALTFAELAAAMPSVGGEYVYLREAYGPMWGFLYGWTQMWVAKSGSIATLATAFFYYLANFHPSLENVLWTLAVPIGPDGGPLEIRAGQLLAIAVILLLTGVNFFGVKFGGRVQVAVTIVKLGCIIALIVVGVTASSAQAANLSSKLPVAPVSLWSGFFAAMVAALWAYDGWNSLTMISSEIKEPKRNLPLALIVGSLVVMAIYMLANVAYFMVLSASEVAATDRVAAAMMRKITGEWGAAAVSIAAMISIFAALNGSILSGSRIPYAMARDGLFFKAAGKVHADFGTPSVSILAMGTWSALLVLSGRYEQLFTYVIFASWILYGMATASVIVLRTKRPELERPYRTWGYPIVPILFVLVAVGLLYETLKKSPRESLMGIAIMLLGVPFYFYWKRKNRSEHGRI